MIIGFLFVSTNAYAAENLPTFAYGNTATTSGVYPCNHAITTAKYYNEAALAKNLTVAASVRERAKICHEAYESFLHGLMTNPSIGSKFFKESIDPLFINELEIPSTKLEQIKEIAGRYGKLD